MTEEAKALPGKFVLLAWWDAKLLVHKSFYVQAHSV